MVVLAMGLWFAACEADEPCDEGQTHTQGACTPKQPAKDAASDEPDTGPKQTDSGSGGGACGEDRSVTLGKACADDDGCNCSAPYCAKQPGQPMGTCTVFCKPMPDDCPEGYRCFDLAAVGVSGYQPFCIKK
ncbi:MAG TPA: hypothetical protein VJR89_29670 [Polyangiales bacterium]|nr:hypothetical protein [Polyangiales bacterium]